MSKIKTVIEKMTSVAGFSDRYEVVEIESSEIIGLVRAKDYGDLPIWITVSSDVVTFKAALTYIKDVDDVNELNEALLSAMGQGLFPLASFGTDEDSYFIMGTLSNDSKPEVFVQELNMLAVNAIEVMTTILEDV